jgi:hypothetical protein
MPGSATAGTPYGGDSGDPIGRRNGDAERPPTAQRGVNDRGALEPECVKQRCELRNCVLAQRAAAVIECVAQPEPGQIERDQTVTPEMRHQRRHVDADIPLP